MLLFAQHNSFNIHFCNFFLLNYKPNSHLQDKHNPLKIIILVLKVKNTPPHISFFKHYRKASYIRFYKFYHFNHKQENSHLRIYNLSYIFHHIQALHSNNPFNIYYHKLHHQLHIQVHIFLNKYNRFYISLYVLWNILRILKNIN